MRNAKCEMSWTVYVIVVYIGAFVCDSKKTQMKRESDRYVADLWSSMYKPFSSLLRPNYTGQATQVSISMTILRFGSIDEISKTFLADMFFRQKWHDYRLKHNLSRVLTPFMGRRHPSEFIWTPDTIFDNEHKGHVHSITTSNHKVDIHPDGTIYWGCRITVEASCDFDLRSYPMDSQTCFLQLESYSYNIKQMTYYWDEKSAVSISKKELPQHALEVINTTKTDLNYAVGSYSTLKVMFQFERRIAVSLLQVFFPCIALVAVSWVSLWLHQNCVSARMGLGVMTLLTLCKMWLSFNQRLPEISYLTALDWYMICCFSFIFTTILEYAVLVNYGFGRTKKEKAKSIDEARAIQRNISKILSTKSVVEMAQMRRCGRVLFMKPKKEKNKIVDKTSNTLLLIDNMGRKVQRLLTNREKKTKIKNDYIVMWKKDAREKRPYYYKPYAVTGKPASFDIVSRLFFPFCFLCFNIIFWVTYHHSHSDRAHKQGTGF